MWDVWHLPVYVTFIFLLVLFVPKLSMNDPIDEMDLKLIAGSG